MCFLWLLLHSAPVLSSYNGNYTACEAQVLTHWPFTVRICRAVVLRWWLPGKVHFDGKGRSLCRWSAAFQTVLWSPPRMCVSWHTHCINQKKSAPIVSLYFGFLHHLNEEFCSFSKLNQPNTIYSSDSPSWLHHRIIRDLFKASQQSVQQLK